ncbi:MAG: restriction endonuclease [Sulfolobales archaeon]
MSSEIESFYKRELIINILKLGTLDAEIISRNTRLPKEIVSKLINELEISYLDKTSLAMLYMSLGGDPERVSNYLNWRDFESFVGRSLEDYGYIVARSIRLPPPRGLEIDVMALDKKLRRLFIIDCKHWKRSRESELRQVAIEMLNKINVFMRRCFLIARNHPWIYLAKSITPLIVTLRQTEIKQIENSVIILPIAFFRDFFNNLDLYLDELNIRVIRITCGNKDLKTLFEKNH